MGYAQGSSVVNTANIVDSAVTTAKVNDDAITLAKLAGGTDGELITWDASGDPAAVGAGTSGQVLTSNGAGAAPTMQTASGLSAGDTILAADGSITAPGFAFNSETSSGLYSSGTHQLSLVAGNSANGTPGWDFNGFDGGYFYCNGDRSGNMFYARHLGATGVKHVANFAIVDTSPDNNATEFLRCNDSTATRMTIDSDGDLYNHDGTYGTISDIKLKQDVTDAASQWDDIKAIRFVKYRLKDKVAANPDAPAFLGVVAQELELVSPGLVRDKPDTEHYEDPELDEEGQPVLNLATGQPIVTPKIRDLGTATKTVKTSILYMKAVKALQEAMARIETLEAKVAVLEGV